MADISEIVSISVSIESASTSTDSFDVPLYISTHNVFTSRFQIYTSASDATNAGFTSDHPVTTYLTNLFAGDQAPSEAIIGRKLLESITLTIDTADADETYAFTIVVGSTSTSISVDGASAIATIEGLITTELDSVSGITYSADGAGNIEITPDTTDSVFYINGLTDYLSLTYNADGTEDYTTAYAAIDSATDEDWFFLSADSIADADVLELAGLAATNSDMYVVAVNDSDVVDSSVTDDIGSQLDDLSRENTVCLYHSSADTGAVEGAVIGSWAGSDAGTTTLHGKTLDGVSVDSLTSTQISAAQNKNVSTYVEIAGDGFLLDGFTSSGEYADTIRFALWLESRVGEACFSLIKSKADAGKKVPMGNAGFAMVRTVIANVLDIAYNRGAIILDDDGAKYVISIPERSEISASDRASRLLPDVEFSVVYSGAIHRISGISGTVSI